MGSLRDTLQRCLLAGALLCATPSPAPDWSTAARVATELAKQAAEESDRRFTDEEIQAAQRRLRSFRNLLFGGDLPTEEINDRTSNDRRNRNSNDTPSEEVWDATKIVADATGEVVRNFLENGPQTKQSPTKDDRPGSGSGGTWALPEPDSGTGSASGTAGLTMPGGGSGAANGGGTGTGKETETAARKGGAPPRGGDPLADPFGVEDPSDPGLLRTSPFLAPPPSVGPLEGKGHGGEPLPEPMNVAPRETIVAAPPPGGRRPPPSEEISAKKEPPSPLVTGLADDPELQKFVEAVENGEATPTQAVTLLNELKGISPDPQVQAVVTEALETLAPLVETNDGKAALPPLSIPLVSPLGAAPVPEPEGTGLVRRPRSPDAKASKLLVAIPKASGGTPTGAPDVARRRAARLAALQLLASRQWLGRLTELVARMAHGPHAIEDVQEDIDVVGWFGPPRPPPTLVAHAATELQLSSRLLRFAPALLLASVFFWALPFSLLLFRARRRHRRRKTASAAAFPALPAHELSKVVSLYDRLGALPTAEQLEALSREALYDPSLVAHVGTLLQQPSAVARFLEQPAFQELSRFAEMPATGLPSGMHVGDYELGRELGRGAIASVYEARQLSLDRRVALKISPLLIGGEARLLAQLEHRNVVRVFSESFDRSRGWRLLAMQLVTGVGLDRLVATMGHGGEEPEGTVVLAAVDSLVPEAPLDAGATTERADVAELGPIEWIASVGAQLADALHAAHERRVLHLDVKPSNILVSVSGRPYLTDFNVSVMGAGTGVVAKPRGGTLRYMSPEQRRFFTGSVEDEEHEPVDARSDIYSLGVVLAELLGICSVTEPARRRLELLVERCLEVDRARRPASALSLADELRSVGRESRGRGGS